MKTRKDGAMLEFFSLTMPLALSLDYHLPSEPFKANLEKNLVVNGPLSPNSLKKFMWKTCFKLFLTGGLVFEIKIFLVCLLSLMGKCASCEVGFFCGC